jgi:tetratricopeptide (TPR) repeat protein
VEEEYAFRLCWDCRRRLSRRPFPRDIKLMCALAVIALIYAVACYPSTLGATLAYRDGQIAEKAKDFSRAIQEYQAVLESYPEWPPALAHLGISLYRNGNTLEAIWVLGPVWHRNNPKELASEVNTIFNEVKRRAGVR